MRQADLCGRQQRRYRVQTTDSNHDQPIAPKRVSEKWFVVPDRDPRGVKKFRTVEE
jgi:hypothetical protein